MTGAQSSSEQPELQLEATPATPPDSRAVMQLCAGDPGPLYRKTPSEGWVALSVGFWRYYRRHEFVRGWLEEVEGAYARVRIPLYHPSDFDHPVEWLTHWTLVKSLRRPPRR